MWCVTQVEVFADVVRVVAGAAVVRTSGGAVEVLGWVTFNEEMLKWAIVTLEKKKEKSLFKWVLRVSLQILIKWQ